MANLEIFHGGPDFDYRQLFIDVLTEGAFDTQGSFMETVTLTHENITLTIQASEGFDVTGPRSIAFGKIASLTLKVDGTTVAVLNNLPSTISGGSIQSLMDATYSDPSDINIIYSFAAINAFGSADSDSLHGTQFGDTLDGSEGRDMIFAGDGDDLIGLADTASKRGDYVRPGLGDNTINATAVFGSDGKRGGHEMSFNDLIAKITVDLKAGTASAAGMSTTFDNVHYVAGTHGNDILKGGGPAKDWEAFVGNAGKDNIDGRGGFDFVFYDDEVDYGAATAHGWKNGTKGVVVNLANKTAKDSYGDTDTLKNIEGAIGTRFKDKLTGDSKANHFVGHQSADTLNGAGGDDTLQGGEGKDVLVGGAGRDSFYFGEFGNSVLDTISDFESGTDTIELEMDVFLDIGAKLSRGEFLARASGHDAKDEFDRIIFDKQTRTVWYDRDGSEHDYAAQKVATLQVGASLKFGDFDMV